MPLIRYLLTRQLGGEADLQVVAQAANGQEALVVVERYQPRVILLDLDMPIVSGASAAREIAARWPHTRIILLTAHASLAQTTGNLVGAWCALSKQCTPAELVAAVRSAAHDVAAETEISVSASPVQTVSAHYNLTSLEQSVLEKLVEADLTRVQIARTLTLDGPRAISESAVKHAQERILDKIKVEPRTRAALIRFVLETSSNRS